MAYEKELEDPDEVISKSYKTATEDPNNETKRKKFREEIDAEIILSREREKRKYKKGLQKK